jgi:hypothetical protein
VSGDDFFRPRYLVLSERGHRNRMAIRVSGEGGEGRTLLQPLLRHIVAAGVVTLVPVTQMQEREGKRGCLGTVFSAPTLLSCHRGDVERGWT